VANARAGRGCRGQIGRTRRRHPPPPDHVGAVASYASEFDATVWARAGWEDEFESATGIAPDRTFRDGTTIPVSGGGVDVVETPGHAPGSTSPSPSKVTSSSATSRWPRAASSSARPGRRPRVSEFPPASSRSRARPRATPPRPRRSRDRPATHVRATDRAPPGPRATGARRGRIRRDRCRCRHRRRIREGPHWRARSADATVRAHLESSPWRAVSSGTAIERDRRSLPGASRSSPVRRSGPFSPQTRTFTWNPSKPNSSARTSARRGPPWPTPSSASASSARAVVPAARRARSTGTRRTARTPRPSPYTATVQPEEVRRPQAAGEEGVRLARRRPTDALRRQRG